MATTKKTRSTMPVSKATNAFELLGEIRKIILEEPKRYDQAGTLTVGGDCKFFRRGAPKCNTVGCVAGWVVAITTAPRRLAEAAKGSILPKAQKVLGVDDDDAYRLFFGGPISRSDRQTASYARAGAAHIARFMKAHEAQLKAKKV